MNGAWTQSDRPWGVGSVHRDGWLATRRCGACSEILTLAAIAVAPYWGERRPAQSADELGRGNSGRPKRREGKHNIIMAAYLATL